MDDSPVATPAPRRSQRERKPVTPFSTGIILQNTFVRWLIVCPGTVKRKRKFADIDAGDHAQNIEVQDEQQVQSGSAPEGNSAGQKALRQRQKRVNGLASKAKGAPPAKRPRATEREIESQVSSDTSAEESDEPINKAKESLKVKTKRPRKTKGVTTALQQNKPAGRRGRRVKQRGEAYDAEKIAKETKIATDNALFSAHRAFILTLQLGSDVIHRCSY